MIPGGQRGVFSRNVQGDPRTTFPRLARGSLRFDRALDPDARVGGDFHLTFENGIEVPASAAPAGPEMACAFCAPRRRALGEFWRGQIETM